MARDSMRWQALHTILLLVFLSSCRSASRSRMWRSHQKTAAEHRGDKPAAA
jgi:hypothetical protein